jgi:hypothetical protein
MNITLRKAAAVQTAINEAVKALELETSVSVNEFQDPEAEISRVASELKTNITRRDSLIGALYEIRSAVNHANYGSGVNDKLAAVARLEKDIQFYNGLAGKTVRMEATVLSGKLAKIKNRPSDSRTIMYGMDDTVTSSVFDRADIEGFRKAVAAAKKQKQKIQDELLEANVRNEVELSAATVAVLTTEGLL